MTDFFVLYSCYVTQLDVPSRQTTPTRHTRVLDSSFRCLDKEDKRPQKVGRAVRAGSGLERVGWSCSLLRHGMLHARRLLLYFSEISNQT